jgi:hypothetical protein
MPFDKENSVLMRKYFITFNLRKRSYHDFYLQHDRKCDVEMTSLVPMTVVISEFLK